MFWERFPFLSLIGTTHFPCQLFTSKHTHSINPQLSAKVAAVPHTGEKKKKLKKKADSSYKHIITITRTRVLHIPTCNIAAKKTTHAPRPSSVELQSLLCNMYSHGSKYSLYIHRNLTACLSHSDQDRNLQSTQYWGSSTSINACIFF